MPTRKWGSEKLVNTGLAGEQVNSSVAALIGGGFVVVWQDNSATVSAIRSQRYDAVGNKLGAEIAISAIAVNQDGQSEPSVTGLADGGFYVSWTDFDSATDHDIVGAVFNASGGFLRRQDGESATVDDTVHSAVARLGTGSVVAWEGPDAEGTGIQFRIFDAAGIGGAVVEANIARAANQRNPSVGATPNGSKFAVVWDSNFDLTIRGGLFTAAGTQFAPEFIIASGPSGAFDPVVAWLNNGEFAVAWVESNGFSAGDDQIRVKIFDGQSATPTALTGNILVNSTTFAAQQDPQITALPNGGFVVSWEDNSWAGGDSSFAVRLQAFDGAGGKIGGEMLVNTTTTGFQYEPSVAALADGRVVVSWTDFSSGNGDIRMQIVDPRDGIVNGTPGADTLYGHDLVNDEISAGAGNDLLLGLKGDDALYGGDGHDRLRGGLGADDLEGGAGSDAADYSDSTAAVNVDLTTGIGSGGFAVGDTYVDMEGLTGSNFADVLTGNALANTLNGAAGADVMRGLAGSDAFTVDNAGDVVDESVAGSNGSDLVGSSVSFSLSDTVHAKGLIEHLTLSGAAFINGTGNALANTLTGNIASNTLDGAGGADYMRGLGHNDTYIVDSAGDVVDEEVAGSGGFDVVRTTVTVNLSDATHFKGFIDHVTLLGAAAIHATGNGLRNTLTGNGAANILTGRAGLDTLIGGAGNDHFLFDVALGPSNIDFITDFDVDGAGADSFDTIRLENAVFTLLTTTGDLAPARFARVASDALGDNGSTITYVSSTGRLFYDTNGATAGGATQFAFLDPGLALTAADFFVV